MAEQPPRKSNFQRKNMVDEASTFTTPNEEVSTLPDSLRHKIDIRLCTIAGVLCSLNLLDSGIISSASVTSMFSDLQLGVDNRYSVAILVFTVASIVFQLPATLAVRYFGPRTFFGTCTFLFGVITFCTAFIHSYGELIALRILMGIVTSGIYPGLSLLISTWYTRKEQQLRFAFLQTGEVTILATGSIVNYGLQRLDGAGGLAGWRWIFLVQGIITALLGILTYFWMVDFPDESHKTLGYLSTDEKAVVLKTIEKDRGDAALPKFSWSVTAEAALDPKTYGFASMFFCQNVVSTALSYFLPTILKDGLGYTTEQSILLSAPPYYYSIIPALLSSFVGDLYRIRGPTILFNAACLTSGIAMLGFSRNGVVRYVGTFLATGAYVSNWAAISAYWSNNVVGQWKRAYVAALVTAFNGAGGIAGSFIFRQSEAPRYQTAISVSIASQLLLCIFVALFTIFFFSANRKQAQGKLLVKGVSSFRYTY